MLRINTHVPIRWAWDSGQADMLEVHLATSPALNFGFCENLVPPVLTYFDVESGELSSFSIDKPIPQPSSRPGSTDHSPHGGKIPTTQELYLETSSSIENYHPGFFDVAETFHAGVLRRERGR